MEVSRALWQPEIGKSDSLRPTLLPAALLPPTCGFAAYAAACPAATQVDHLRRDGVVKHHAGERSSFATDSGP